jgi:hypothetical protein
LFVTAGFTPIICHYVYRPTRNMKEGVCVQRVFVEARFRLLPE